MTASDLWGLPSGLIGGAFWMWMLRSMLGGTRDANVWAFKAMIVLMLLVCVIAATFPDFAVLGPKGVLTTVGYLIVMAWFWKDKRLVLISRERTNG